jgi:hypothetical protein
MSPGIGFIAMRGRSPGALRGRAFFRHGGGRVRREGLLVVDDLADTGATVYAKPLGRPFVDTFITEVSQDTWIYFPWDLGLSYQAPIAGSGQG